MRLSWDDDERIGMRIVAGEHRGRVLKVPEGLDTRPTTDRVREAVMSSLYSMLGGFEGVYVLDAFSGSGAMGIEAVSRGAEGAILNDASSKSRKCISDNVSALRLSSDVAVLGRDILAGGLPSGKRPYDLVFLDPPYATSQEDVAALLADANGAGLLAPECVVVYEHDSRADDALAPSGLRIESEKHYGKTYVTYLRA